MKRALALLALVAGSCGSADPRKDHCIVQSDCLDGYTCMDQRCVANGIDVGRFGADASAGAGDTGGSIGDAGTAVNPDASMPPDAAMLFPADNEVVGWIVDARKSPKGIEIAHNALESEWLVDGDTTPFELIGFTQMAREFYKKGTYSLELRVWLMKDSIGAQAIYTKKGLYDTAMWTSQAIGEEGRYGNYGTYWRVDSRKDAFFVEASISTAPPDDTVGRNEAIAMVTAAVAKAH